MVPETPPCENHVWTGIGPTDLYSASDQLIATQLIRAWIGHPFIVGSGRGGAEWRCVDFELSKCSQLHGITKRTDTRTDTRAGYNFRLAIRKLSGNSITKAISSHSLTSGCRVFNMKSPEGQASPK